MTKRKFSFVQLDVFTSRPLEGNQLAVFTDARGLSDDEMQKLARETNLCETTFILPREEAIERAEGHKVRIFTVNEELPFAGHPTLGTAWYLRQHSSADEIVLDLKIGKIPVRFEQRDGLLFGEMRQAEPQFGAVHPHDVIAGVLGVPLAELDERLPIQTVSTGMPFTMVPFRSLATLQKLSIGWNQMAPYLGTIGNPAFFYFVCRETVDPASDLARAHDLLQRRRSGYRLRCGMLHGLGGEARRAGAGGARADRARNGNAASKFSLRSRREDGKTRSRMCGSEVT